MKKIIGVSVITLAIYSLFLSSVSVSAQKADFGFSMPSNYAFNINSMDGATSVSIQVAVYGQSSYQTITGYGGITYAGTYNKTSLEMENQFGTGDFQCRVQDNFNVNHFSQSIRFTIP
jgi:hypothetical protein